jgi:hypothetical protein
LRRAPKTNQLRNAIEKDVKRLRADRLATIGSVVDHSTTQSIANATVMVYSAGVKKGYDLFCPSCYVDCGKRTVIHEKDAFPAFRA